MRNSKETHTYKQSCVYMYAHTYIHTYYKLSSLSNSHRARSALMAVWPKALPLTASCLSFPPGFETDPGHVQKWPVTRWKVSGFRQVLRFHPPVTTGLSMSRLSRYMAKKCQKTKFKRYSSVGSQRYRTNPAV